MSDQRPILIVDGMNLFFFFVAIAHTQPCRRTAIRWVDALVF